MMIELPDHVVASFEGRIEITFPEASDSERRIMLRMLCESWTEGAVAERVESDERAKR